MVKSSGASFSVPQVHFSVFSPKHVSEASSQAQIEVLVFTGMEVLMLSKFQSESNAKNDTSSFTSAIEN